MKISIIGLGIFVFLAGMFFGISIAEPSEHKCENEWWMRFGKTHLEKCDTLHKECFKNK
jgi:hypothetical protein